MSSPFSATVYCAFFLLIWGIVVLASHIIFTTYGFWHPNDPRGSWSDFVRSFDLLAHGPATKTTERRSVAHRTHDRDQRLRAKEALTYPPVHFSGQQALEIARGMTQAVAESNYIVRACSIMPDHVHAVVDRHEHPAELIIGHFKKNATRQLLNSGLHPMQDAMEREHKRISCWTSRGWKVFLDSPQDIDRAVRYVNNNPIRAGFKAQHWNFVTAHSVRNAQ